MTETNAATVPGTGPALVVQGPTDGVGLELRAGAFRVTGAGVNTQTAAFVFRATNTGPSKNHCRDEVNGETFWVVDHPDLNNRPDALLFVTSVYPNKIAGQVEWLDRAPLSNCRQRRWAIIGPPSSESEVVHDYNVLVIRA